MPYQRNKPDEQNDLFEGDIRLPTSTSRGVLKLGNAATWSNGIVPYIIAPGYEPEQEQFIVSTMRKMEKSLAINNVLCIRFRQKLSSDQYYITIRNSHGCSSFVGQPFNMVKERTVSLDASVCLDHGRIMHELLHTLGFYHEQSRPDRDDYVKIHLENIQSGQENNFNKYNSSLADTQNTPYDYGSVMHYAKDDFSNGSPTIEPIEPNVEIGQRRWMSPIDIQEVQLAYKCPSSGLIPSIVSTTTTGALTTNHEVFVRPGSNTANYYYEAIQIMVDRTGIYDIISLSNMDTFGYIYEDTFDPSNPSRNLYKDDDESGGNGQFRLTLYLEVNVPYILVVSTYDASITGPFSVIATGPGNVQYIPIDSTVITTSSTTTRPEIISSYYSNELTLNSETFSPVERDGSIYYYNTIEVTVKTTGSYTFEISSSMNPYGYLYQENFYPSDPWANLLFAYEESVELGLFESMYYLRFDIKYILVVTTDNEHTTGPFNIIASGPDDISFSPISN